MEIMQALIIRVDIFVGFTMYDIIKIFQAVVFQYCFMICGVHTRLLFQTVQQLVMCGILLLLFTITVYNKILIRDNDLRLLIFFLST